MDKGQVEIRKEGKKYYCYFKDASNLPAAVHGALKNEKFDELLCSLVNSGGEFLEGSSGDCWRTVRLNLDEGTVAVMDNHKCMLFVPLKDFKNTTQVFCILEGKDETTNTPNDKNK